MEERVERKDRRVAIWLLVSCGMIAAMVVLGGVTRLTRSGLSIVEWKPLSGVLPPWSRAEWEAEFSRYKAFPEYKKINRGMTLEEFKSIYWMEYLHRLWGRLIGVVFFVPFVFFWWWGYLTRRLVWHSWLIFAGGGLQGVMGWYMVKSGLIQNPYVSQYRLAAHLSIAFVLYAYILWIALGLLWPPERAGEGGESKAKEERDRWRRLSWGTGAFFGAVGLMVISGGFVAGLKAGLIFNTFPKMGPFWIPPNLFPVEPWYVNLFETHATVQFVHRSWAYLLILAVGWLFWKTRQMQGSARFERLRWGLVGMLLLQVSLGIATLLLYVPVSLGALHQSGALGLFTVALLFHAEVRRLATGG